MACPAPMSAPRNLKKVNTRYPETLVDVIMNSYCSSTLRHDAKYFCNTPDSCACYKPQQIASYAVVRQENADTVRRLVAGVPYTFRDKHIKYNFFRDKKPDKSSNEVYPFYAKTEEKTRIIEQFSAGHFVASTVPEEELQKYKDKTVRDINTVKIADVISAYLKDPICILGSNIYRNSGWKPELCAEKSRSYRLTHLKGLWTSGTDFGHNMESSLQNELELMKDHSMDVTSRNIPSLMPMTQGTDEEEEDFLDDLLEDEIRENPLRFCSTWDILRERHNITINTTFCSKYLERLCDYTTAGPFCRPIVQQRFYLDQGTNLYITVEHYSFSSVFALYLGPEKLKCGSKKSLERGLFYMEDMLEHGVAVLDEVTRGNRRFFHVGPFNTTKAVGKYNICACFNQDGEIEGKRCYDYSEYTSLLGEVVIRPKWKPPIANVSVGKRENIQGLNRVALVLDMASGAPSCESLLDMMSVDWYIPSVKRSPNLSNYITVVKQNEDENIDINFTKPGIYRVCLIFLFNGEVTDHTSAYAVNGIKDNASAVIYKKISGEYVGSSLVFEHINKRLLDVKSIVLVDSENNCTAEVIGHWAGGIHPYYMYMSNDNITRWVAKKLEFKFKKNKILPSYAICVSYKDKSGRYKIGNAMVQNFADENDSFIYDTPFDIKGPVDDLYNYTITKNSDEMIALLKLLKMKEAGCAFISTCADNLEYYYSIIDGAERITMQFRTSTSLNKVSLWLLIDDDPTPFPARTFSFDKPRALRLGMNNGTLYAYILLSDSRLHRIPFSDIFDPLQYNTERKEAGPFNDVKYMDIIQYNNRCSLVLVDNADMCIYLYNEELVKITSICNNASNKIPGPGRITCVPTDKTNVEHNCFLAMPLLNSILWMKVTSANQMTIVDRYDSDEANLHVDPIAGSPVSLFAVPHDKEAMVFVIYESGEHGILLRTVGNKSLEFMSTLLPAGNGYLMRFIVPISFNDNLSTIMVLSQSPSKALVDTRLDVDQVFEKAMEKDSTTWRYTWMTLGELVKLPVLNYDVPEWMLIGRKYEVQPIFDYGFTAKSGDTYTVVPKAKVNAELVDTNLAVDKNGLLSIHSSILLRDEYDIVFRNMWLMSRTTVQVNVGCPDGMYHDGSTCQLCTFGTYNSHEMILNNADLVLKCTPCPANQTTMGLGAKSVDECTCIAGYSAKIEGPGPKKCEPCGVSSYKSALGFGQCAGTCGQNAFSTNPASLSQADMFCRCFPGFYYNRGGEGERGGCKPCEEGYYCVGGYKSRQRKCPVYTTTLNQAAVSIDDCVCSAGYEPARPINVSTRGTFEYEIGQRIKATHNIRDYHKWVCVPCPNNMYKAIPSSDPCTRCPNNTYSLTSGNSNAKNCNRCGPGYYETNDFTNPCEVCPPNHICVGSDPIDPSLKLYSGKRIKCDKNSVTLAPYEDNTHAHHCLCDKGYMARTRNGIVKCEAVPKNTYKDVVGNVGPTQCPNGSYTLSPGATSANECVCHKGMFFDEAHWKCVICPVGKFCLGGRLPNGDHMPPTVCADENSITTEPGASSPSECLCKPGYYMRQDGLSGCVQCPENTYKSHVSNESCSECDKNSLTYGELGATSKDQCICAPGYYLDGTCKPCGFADKYCPGGYLSGRDPVTGKGIYLNKDPVQCPPYTKILPGVETAFSVSNCQCGKGYALAKMNDNTHEKVCVPCAPGSYKSTVIDSSCNGLCTQNATSKAGAHSPAQCYCQRGYYYLAGGICAPCVEGARCDGGVVEVDEVGADADGNDDQDDDVVVRRTHINPVPIEGYFLDKINQELRKPDDWRFIMCPIKGACLGEKGCSESMTAYLCAECKTGYTNNFKKGTLCTKCPKTMTNVVLTIAWYLGLLLVNIVMACLNVSAGYNRRSIHSVVIKIALNYGICMSVLNVINFGDLALPAELKSYTLRWFKVIHRESSVVHTSIDCLLQHWFGMTHAVSFFYSMLFIACLPVILLVVVTVLMWVILELFKIKRHHVTRSKLALLYQSSLQGMHYLADRLRDEYANERLFLIFRYIPLPGETRWVRFKHFLEDMIPIYVTVLFSVHGNTTSQMLSLLDCTCIHLGQSVPSKYMLRPAMSIRCSLDPGSAYFPYLLLGLGGLIFWGFGIPFFSYIVLLVNRKKLYAPDVRMKYGFLHNGYQQEYWFWEAIVFTRKSLVLVIGSIVIVPSENTSASRMWMALAVAVVFLIIQLIYKPFDERDYFVLGRLESHSMISWTANLLAVSLMCYVTLTPFVVTTVCALVLINSGYFFYVVFKSFLRSLVDTIRYKGENRFFKKLRWLVDAVLFFDSRRYLREPQITYNQTTSYLQLRITRHRYTWFGKKTYELKPLERYYFVNIVTELYRIVVSHLKLDVMPKLLIEFLVRLSLSLRRFEEKMAKRELFQELSDGDLSTLVAWAAEKESHKLNRIVNLEEMDDDEAFSNVLTDEKSLGAAIGLRQEELQFIMDCLFDDKVLGCNTRLTDFYHCLTRIWIMDIDMLTFLFTMFRRVKSRRDKDNVARMEETNAKLRKTHGILMNVKEGIEASDSITLKKSIVELEEQVKSLIAKREQLSKNLKEMRENPDAYVPEVEKQAETSMDELMLQVGFCLKNGLRRNDENESLDDESGSSVSDEEYETDSGDASDYTTDESDD
uniref:GCC2 and GCC3 domain containing protein n=2 Tax=Babesia bovis TaxID=5865 RepID=A7AQ92_BABBO|eukprot:XP_001612294.1 GCC2 and GCC3 domain containing protein [Babesia bovis T2Bo]